MDTRPLGERLLDWLLPQRCAGCGSFPRPLVCDECRARLQPLRPPCCERCGEPFAPLAHHGPLCAGCRASPPPFERARSAFLYQEPLRTILHRLKFGRRHGLAAPLGRLLVAALAEDLREPIPLAEIRLLVAVPLHRARQRQRGFNQSELLAREMAGPLRRPLAAGCLRRARATRPQVGLTASQRRRNVRGAFQAVLPAGTNARGVLLIDDLYTTGSTARECARALRRAGAHAVWVLTLARAAPSFLLTRAYLD